MIEAADIVAKFLREKGFKATARGLTVSVKIDGIRRTLPIEPGGKVFLCNNCSVDLYAPESLEWIYKAGIHCIGEGNGCEECPPYQAQKEKEKENNMLLLQRTVKCC